jgi:hypothetical protein
MGDRSADLALLSITSAADHIRDCPRCYALLERECRAWWDENVAEADATTSRMAGEQLGKFFFVPPRNLWGLIGNLFTELVRCEGWPKLTV